METQTITSTEDICPKDIVQQLLDIAKRHDALDEIGGATSWRWQEGIISRMPKTKTVAKILKRSYRSDDPAVWVNQTSGSLQLFLKRAFNVEGHSVSNFEPEDIFEAAIFLTLIDGRGFEFSEMVIRLSLLKYAKNHNSDEFFHDVNEDAVLQLHERWAIAKIESVLTKLAIKKNKAGRYAIEKDIFYTSQKLIEYQNEIGILRNRQVGDHSNFDMWRQRVIALTDEEMIDIERKILKFYQQLSNEIEEVSQKRSESLDSTVRTRLFSLSAVSLQSSLKEGLSWKR